MRYEKPLVVDLSAGARARGQGPLSCITGNVAQGASTCMIGNGANEYCSTGNSVTGSCVGGGNVGGTSCYSGGSPSGYCVAGVTGANDPTGCKAGPSYT